MIRRQRKVPKSQLFVSPFFLAKSLCNSCRCKTICFCTGYEVDDIIYWGSVRLPSKLNNLIISLERELKVAIIFLLKLLCYSLFQEFSKIIGVVFFIFVSERLDKKFVMFRKPSLFHFHSFPVFF